MKENKLFSILLSVTNALSGLILLMFSAWFIAACAVAGTGFNYLLPAVAIRGLALTKIASGYGYMWFGHKVVLTAMSQLRNSIFKRLMTGIPENKTQQLESVAKHSEQLAATWINVICHVSGVVAMLVLCQGFVVWQQPAASELFLIMLLGFVIINIAVVFWGLKVSQKLLTSHNRFVFELENELCNSGLWHLRDDLQLPDASDTWIQTAKLNRLVKNGVLAFHGLNLVLLVALINSGVLIAQGPILLVPILLLLTAKDWLAPGFSASAASIAANQAKHEMTSLRINSIVKSDSDQIKSDEVISLRQFCATNRNMPNVTMDFSANGIHLITGSSGCGKSSLLSGMAGLLAIQGKLAVGEKEVAVLPDTVLVEQNIGCLSDTLRGNLTIANQESKDEALLQVLSALGLTDLQLNEWVGSKGRRLSGGELKRLGLARAMLSGKSVWLLDEPFEGLDSGSLHKVLSLLNVFSQDKTIIIATHIIPEAMSYKQIFDMDKACQKTDKVLDLEAERAA